MSNLIAEAVVRKNVRVQAPIERAFSVFVEQMETWWPATHHIGKTPFEAIFVEPRVGGRWYERDAAGNLNDWGTVLAWDPPHRFIDTQLSGPYKLWHHEHRFIAEGNGTRITDEVQYLLPFGVLGTIAHALKVKNDVKTIFAYRTEAVNRLFGTAS